MRIAVFLILISNKINGALLGLKHINYSESMLMLKIKMESSEGELVMNLSQIKPRKKYVLKYLPKKDPLSRRLADMGFSEGMEVFLILKSKGLAEIKIGETLVGLRLGDCDKTVIYEDGQ